VAKLHQELGAAGAAVGVGVQRLALAVIQAVLQEFNQDGLRWAGALCHTSVSRLRLCRRGYGSPPLTGNAKKQTRW
jgi:hypothetical protein